MRKQSVFWATTLLTLALLLQACAPAVSPDVDGTSAPPDSQEVSSADSHIDSEPPAQTPDGVTLDATVSIFSEPSYDGSYVQIVGQDGTYTITEEATDAEGNRWGKLDSGLGWVDLTALSAPVAPVTACYAEESLLQNCDCMVYIIEDSEYTVQIAFRATETLRDVQLLSVQPFAESGEAQMLCAFDTLEAGTALVYGVVFYGDMTAYALSFTDAAGTSRCFEVTVSGRNGALVLRETALPDAA